MGPFIQDICTLNAECQINAKPQFSCIGDIEIFWASYKQARKHYYCPLKLK